MLVIIEPDLTSLNMFVAFGFFVLYILVNKIINESILRPEEVFFHIS